MSLRVRNLTIISKYFKIDLFDLYRFEGFLAVGDQPDKAVLRHTDEDDRMKRTVIDNLGREQKMYIINESGLYALVLSSKLPQAKAFKRWVTAETSWHR